jgi:undecaprenyl-diphosphatase
MTWVEAVIYGVIQGLTEFIPVSSTAHLRVAPALLGWPDPGAAFTAVIQWGTWVASVIYFWPDIRRITAAFFRGVWENRPWGTPDARMASLIVVGTIPVVVCGLLFKRHIEAEWRNLDVIAYAAIGMAAVLAAAEELNRWRVRRGHALKVLPGIGWLDAVVVGCFQAGALVPGASRSGTTITGGLFSGMTRESAARFSFLLSLPSVFGAGVKELYDERAALLAPGGVGAANLVIATAVAGAVGFASIAFLMRFLKTHTTYVFIAYRLLFGGLLLALLWRGVLQPDQGAPKNESPRGQAERSHLLDHLVELQVVQVPVERVLGQQFLVDAGGDHAPLVDQEQAVARADRRDAVRQEDAGPAGQHAGQGVVQERLGVVVQGRLRLLDDQQRRVAQDGPRQGNAVLLADAQGVAQLADGRLVALGQLLDEVVGVGQLGRLDDARQRVRRVAAADVVGHRVVEDQVVLQDHGDLGPQRVERHAAQVVLVDADLARGRVEQPWNKINQGVFL